MKTMLFKSIFETFHTNYTLNASIGTFFFSCQPNTAKFGYFTLK